MGVQKIESLIDKFSKNLQYYRDSSNAYNEHSCRIEYIDPLLKILGWDVANEKGLPPQYREVIAENYSNETDRPDYSLTLKGVTKLFVEAKKPAVDVSTAIEPAYQTKKYGWNAKHKIAVLTNFEYLIIYDTTCIPKDTDVTTVARYRKYHYTEYVEKLDEIMQVLSRDAVYNGAFDEYLARHFPILDRQTEQVDEHFLKQINNWRVSLSNYLYNCNEKYKSISVLNDVVQEFINQIVFLRICEDRNLPLYHKLKETIADQGLMKKNLGELFRAADKRYNSGLFEGNYIIFDLDNQIIFDMIEGLYYPQSPYLFNIIEPNLLGKIYEAFLTEQLILSDNQTIVLAKKKDCINRSVVTTPTEIVKYMVSKAMTDLCFGKTPDQLLDLRIADIACGSGIFLEDVYDYLVHYCVEWYSENNPEHLIEINNGRKKLPLEEKKSLLCSCIFGIDIDIHAVEVAKFSLLLKLIEDETTPSVADSTPILPNLSENIFYGNSLIDSFRLKDDDIDDATRIEIVPLDWEHINEGNLFDLVIGNPPYVSTEDMHGLLPVVEVWAYKNTYESAYKQFDKYFMFIERAVEKVKENGMVCYIVPNKFYKIGSGKNLRKLLARNSYLMSLDDFGDAQLFDDKTIYSSILLISKRKNSEFIYTKVNSAASLWAGTETNSIIINNDTLNEMPWRLSTDIEFLQLLKKLDTVSVPITNYADIYNGIQTSAERPTPVYWFGHDEIVNETEKYFTISRSNQNYNIEKKILKPYFKPSKKSEKGLNSYSPIITDKWIIFPYDEDGKLLNIQTMQSEYSGTYEYLMSCYNRLLPKCVSSQGVRDVQDATEDTWYQYGRTQHLRSFINTPKLIVGVLSKDPMYAFDNKDMLIASGGTAGYCAVSLKKDSPYGLEYIQAWLTHPYTEKLLEIIGSDFENGFTARGTFVLKTLPFVELDMNSTHEKTLHDNIVVKTHKIYSINDALTNHPDKGTASVLIREKNQLINEIESIVTQIYRLEFKR